MNPARLVVAPFTASILNLFGSPVVVSGFDSCPGHLPLLGTAARDQRTVPPAEWESTS